MSSRILILIVLTLAGLTFVSGQDLGSSNKLFGNSKSNSSKPSDKSTKSGSKKTSGEKAKSAKKKAPRPVVKVAKPRTSVPTRTARESTPIRTAPISPVDKERYENLIDQGNVERDDRNYTAAETAYLSAQKLDPSDARAFLGMGNLYSDQQRWESAEKAFRSAMAVEKDYVELLTALSFVLTRPLMALNISERYAEAEALARKAIKLSPSNALAYDQLGVALELQGQTGSETESAYRRSTQLDRDFAPAYAHLARLLRKLGRVAEANSAFREAATRAITVGTKLLVADAMHSDQRFADSLPILDLAIRLDPRNPTALTMLGRASTVLGKFTDAERFLKSSIEVAPASMIGYEWLASLRLRQGRIEEAESILMRTISFLAPFEKRRIASQFELVGDAFSKAGSPAKAKRVYIQAGSLDSERDTLRSKLTRL